MDGRAPSPAALAACLAALLTGVAGCGGPTGAEPVETLSQAICLPLPSPELSAAIPPQLCDGKPYGQLLVTAPVGYTHLLACTSAYLVEAVRAALHPAGCHPKVDFEIWMTAGDIPWNATACAAAYVDLAVVGYLNGVPTSLHSSRTYGQWSSGACTGLVAIASDQTQVGSSRYWVYGRGSRPGLFGSPVEAGITLKVSEGL